MTTWEDAARKPSAQALVHHLQAGMVDLDERFAMVPAAHLKQNGWTFKDDELIGEPDSTGDAP